MTTLTIQGFPTRRVPERALALLSVLMRSADKLSRAVASRSEPTTPAEVLDFARKLEATQPSFAADLRAAAYAAEKGGRNG